MKKGSMEPKVKTLTEVKETVNTTWNTPRYFTLSRLDTPVQEDPSGHLASLYNDTISMELSLELGT